MSGASPSPLMLALAGVYQRAIVMRNSEPSGKERICCTEPLPNVCSPMRMARPLSRNAPATNSEALALPPLTNTTSGISSAMSPSSAVNDVSKLPLLLRSYKTTDSGKKISAMATDASKKPPGLSRKSRINALGFWAINSVTACRTLSSKLKAAKVERRK